MLANFHKEKSMFKNDVIIKKCKNITYSSNIYPDSFSINVK